MPTLTPNQTVSYLRAIGDSILTATRIAELMADADGRYEPLVARIAAAADAALDAIDAAAGIPRPVRPEARGASGGPAIHPFIRKEPDADAATQNAIPLAP